MQVAVVGCGYVGLALARRLAPDHEVVGVRRSDGGLEAVADAGADPVRADVTDPATISAVPDVDAVVYAVSAGGRDADAARETYVEAQRRTVETFGGRSSPPDRFLYTSSTGVYGDHGGAWVTEETPLSPATPREAALAAAERVTLEAAPDAGMDATVARLAGLYGPDRYRLDRYLSGPVTAGYRNCCHRADAAGAIAHFLSTDRARGEVVTVVDDEPVSKWALADWLAEACGEPAPPKRTVEETVASGDYSEAAAHRLRASKRCSNEKLRSLRYDPVYPTFRAGYRPAVEGYRAD